MNNLNRLIKGIFLFLVGGGVYILIEDIWRFLVNSHPSHWTMFFVGGLSFLLIGEINEYFEWEMWIEEQMLISAFTITVIEFVSGMILNVWLRLGIWDYSKLPLNLCGQICVPFFFAWFLLSLLGIVIDDYIRWKFFNEERPHYTSIIYFAIISKLLQ